MGQVILRAIEVKREGKWQLLDLPTVKKDHYSKKADEYVESKKFGHMYQDYVEEASLYLRDYVFGHGTDNSLKKPIPDDACNEIKDIIPDYCAYCINLKDWPEYIKEKEEEFKNSISDLYFKKYFKTVNDKLDSLLTNTEYTSPSEDDIDDEREELMYLDDEVWHEKFYFIVSLNCEYNYINDLIYAIYEDWPETRVYYFID